MLHESASALLKLTSGQPAFRIYGRASYEPEWHEIDIYTTHRRNFTSRWPLWKGQLITWTSSIIAMGCDFAERMLQELADRPTTRDNPIEVLGGRLCIGRHCDLDPPAACEVIAHECGHTGQARRWGGWYWAAGATLTLFREGEHRRNHFENEASETGQFGGIVPGSMRK